MEGMQKEENVKRATPMVLKLAEEEIFLEKE